MVVREMLLSDTEIYSNIITKRVPKNHVIDKTHIFKEEVVSVKRDGTEVKKFELNKEHWQKIRDENKTISVIIDEAHTLMNPRRAMSKKSQVITDFMALLRRILGSSDSGYGELILITQLERRLDVIAREMATKVQFCICHYTVICPEHGKLLQENNETSNKLHKCPVCNKNTKRVDLFIEVHSFDNMDKYHTWECSRRRRKVYFERYFITDIERVFKHYNTLQWENLLSD